MKRCLIVITACLFGGATAILGVRGVAQAQPTPLTPAHVSRLEPVQYVYPDWTLAQIQQAIDYGGTVYFQYGEYNQVASSTPALPPTPGNPPKGFNIGTYGMDVHIIGLPGPNGERPRINGGAPTFRMGSFPGLGFFGLPVNFRIENLELFNPDMVGPGSFYSRIGIWVLDLLGAESTIKNCKITVTGRDTDHPNNVSAGIFIRLLGTAPPPSGARIEIANNEIVGVKMRMAIGMGHFWPATDTFTAPRFFVHDNVITVTSLRGGSLSGGAAALVMHGNVVGAIVLSNVFRGDARLVGAENSGILGFSGQVNGVPVYPANVTVKGNDLSQFIGDFQLSLDSGVSGSTVATNVLGPAAAAGVKCDGHDNVFIENHFLGEYPGWEPPSAGPGLFWFANTSYDNRVVATKLNGPPHGSDICGQVLDETGGANRISGDERCQSK